MRIPAALAALSLLVPSALPASPALAADAAADAVVADRLTPEHRAALQCAAVFAIVASEQANGAPAALAFPPLAVRGKRYFVEVSTRVVAEAGLTREQVRDLIVADVGTLQKGASADPADAALATQMRACVPLLDKAVPPLRAPDLLQCTAILSLAFEEIHGREGMTPAAQDMKTLASVLTAREREALIAAGRSSDQADQAIAEAHDAMLKEAFDEGGGVEKYDIAHCYDLPKPDQKSHY